MAVNTPEEFFAVLQKSKLLTPSQLAQAEEIAREQSDPKTIAKRLARKEIITRWQAGQLLAGRSSFYLGKYRLIELLGSGGMGNVFLGRHVTMNRLVALKIISRRVGKDPASLERFLAEARAVAALDHPNIVQAYSVDTEGDRYYLVMEYVEGIDLQRMVKEDGPLECNLAVEYIRQAAEGLEHAHQRNMIHCDVKPSNLLVNVQGVVKILDLGLARFTHDDPSEAGESHDRVLGSVDYLAPEQAVDSGKLDRRADVYSLGCTLYFLLTGRAPFAKGTLHQRIMKHQTKPPPPLPSRVPADLAGICMKMMAKKPDDRYATAAEVVGALAQLTPALSTVKHGMPLLRAKPLNEKNDLDFLGLRLEDGIRGGLADRLAQKNRPRRIIASLLASPLRSTILVLALLLVLIGSSAVVFFVYERSVRNGLEPIGPRAAAPPKTEPDPTGQEYAKPQEPEPPDLPAEPTDAPETPPPEPPVAPIEEHPEPVVPPQFNPSAASPKPEQPAPPSEDAEPPPRIETSLELAEAVDLPPLGEEGENSGGAGPATLGKVRLSPYDALNIELVGGSEVFRAGREFHVVRDVGADVNEAWSISFESESRGAAPAEHREIARIVLHDGELRFFWLAGAAEVPSGNLRNCGLLVSAGELRGFLPLCKPSIVEPVDFDFVRRVNRSVYLRDDMPDTSVLRLQILGFSNEFPTAKMEPGNTIGARKEIVVNYEGPDLPPVKFQVAFDPKPKAVQLEIDASCIMPGKQQYRPLRLKEVETAAAQVSAVRGQLENVAKNPQASYQDRQKARAQLKQSDPLAAQLAALNKFCQEVGKSGKMYFRVYCDFGDRQIDLLVAPPPKNQ